MPIHDVNRQQLLSSKMLGLETVRDVVTNTSIGYTSVA